MEGIHDGVFSMTRFCRVTMIFGVMLLFAVPDAEARSVSRWVRIAKRYQRKNQCKRALDYYGLAYRHRRLSLRYKTRIKRLMLVCERRLEPPKPKRLTPGEIERVINLNRSVISSCYMHALMGNRGLKGRLTVHFEIEPTGKVGASSIFSSTLSDKAIERCITAAFKRIVFPPPINGAYTAVRYPIAFSRYRIEKYEHQPGQRPNRKRR